MVLPGKYRGDREKQKSFTPETKRHPLVGGEKGFRKKERKIFGHSYPRGDFALKKKIKILASLSSPDPKKTSRKLGESYESMKYPSRWNGEPQRIMADL